MQVPHDKDVASYMLSPGHAWCAAREMRCEALTGLRTGQPLSRDRTFVLGADAVQVVEGNMSVRAIASARMTRRGRRPWHVHTLLAREPGDLHLPPQGAGTSPLLANVFLHYVYDLWAVQWRQRQAKGQMITVRYADDVVVGFERAADARAFWDAMRERSTR